MWPETIIPKRTVDLLVRWLETMKNILPNGGGLMVMNPMIESVKNHLKKTHTLPETNIAPENRRS